MTDTLHSLVEAALREDVGERDLTTEATVPRDARSKGILLAKSQLVLAGLAVAREVFRSLDPGIVLDEKRREGDWVEPGTIVVRLSGRARPILTGERVALNFLQRLSGVATLTRRFVDAVRGTNARIRDTRKTTPLLRSLEKQAVELGGGVPHRTRLDSGVLVKDNHIRIAGSVGEAGRLASAAGFPVEVEVERIDQIEEALASGASMILLDNFTPEDVRDAVEQVGGRVPVEVSGGVRLDTVRSFAEAGPDYIAIGALTHSAPAADISLELTPE
jgi:nicotinate-nucleotide pyrophosphorylase (carboxylating)